MTGIEKLTERIGADARAEADAILTEAREQAGAVNADYAQRARKAAEDVLAQGEAAAKQREEHLASTAAMEDRKRFLAVKQEMVGRAFDLALEKLCALPEKEYADLLVKLALKAVSTKREQLIFSPKDRERVGKAVVAAANKALGPKGALTLSEQTRPIAGGFILSDGDVEVNCAFETLIRLQRGEISGQVAKALFD